MFPFGFLAFIAAVVCFAEDRRERLRQSRAELFVVGDVEPRVEGLVREPPARVSGVCVGAVRIGEQPERVMQESPPAGVVLAVFREAAVHIGQSRADAVLVTLQRGQVDSVSEVRREQLVGLRFEA
ncbi:hypothetical protein [Microbacterium aurum]